MELLELMKQRHSVREYLDKPIEEEKREMFNDLIEKLNKEHGTHVQIFYDDPSAFKNATATYGNFSGCNNYIALVGKDAETCGYVGEIIALKAQELGLNTCFVALTYQKGAVKNKVKLEKGEKVQCNIALGYGKRQGANHKIKSYDDVVELKEDKPEHFDEVVEACLLAPTAMNQQKFKITVHNGEIIIKKSGLGFYMDVDLGIVKAHKDLILGKASF